MTLGEQWNAIILNNAGISEREFLQRNIQEFMNSKTYKNMVTGRRYYLGDHDILQKDRSMIDEKGEKQPLLNAPNNKIVNNRFDDLVDQKVNYLLANDVEVKDGEAFEDIFTKAWQKQLKRVAMDSIIGGIGYLHPYVNEKGELKFKRMKPESVIPFWHDEEHEELDAFIYMYDVEIYSKATTKQVIHKVEYYTKEGVSYWEYNSGSLTPDTSKKPQAYLTIGDEKYNWETVPLVPFRFNAEEQPLIVRVKSLQDALNMLMSNFADCMEEDIRSTVLVVRNYDGTDLSTFRRNLAQFGAVKVKSIDGVAGDVSALSIHVDSSNYELILKLLKDAIIENGRGFDAKDDRMGNNPNQMNIRSMYSDIELDANQMEMEFKASLEHLMFFVNTYAGISSKKTADVEFIFNRDLPMNEGDTINNCRNSVGIISMETIVSNHPWTKDTKEEMAKLKQEQAEQMAMAMGADYVDSGGGDHE